MTMAHRYDYILSLSELDLAVFQCDEILSLPITDSRLDVEVFQT
jgi:hypothetical protein